MSAESASRPVDAMAILARHVEPDSRAFEILVTHSVLVARKAREIASHLQAAKPSVEIDLELLTSAALLHDIGITRCDAPGIFCFGSEPYLRHGVIGREILEGEGLATHALFCERHTGAGLTRAEVISGGLPLPDRDFLPLSIEEKILCAADKFYSKDPAKLWREKPLARIERSLARHGESVVERWCGLASELLLTESRRAEPQP